MFVIRFRECSNVWDEGQGVLQYLGLGSGSAPMFGMWVRECSNVLGLRPGSAPMFWIRDRVCSNVWG